MRLGKLESKTEFTKLQGMTKGKTLLPNQPNFAQWAEPFCLPTLNYVYLWYVINLSTVTVRFYPP